MLFRVLFLCSCFLFCFTLQSEILLVMELVLLIAKTWCAILEINYGVARQIKQTNDTYRNKKKREAWEFLYVNVQCKFINYCIIFPMSR